VDWNHKRTIAAITGCLLAVHGILTIMMLFRSLHCGEPHRAVPARDPNPVSFKVADALCLARSQSALA